MSNSVFLKPDENGNWGKVGTDAAGSMSEQLVFQSGATAIGDGAVVDVSGYNSLVATLTSTGSATIAFEYSMDNVLWVSLPGQLVQNTSSNMALNTSLTVTSTVFIRFNIVGVKYVRFRISAYTSGTIGASAVASTGSVQYLLGTSQAFGNVDTNSPNNTVLGVGAFNLLFDGTNWVRQRVVNLGSTDGISISGGVTPAPLLGYNGSTWDRVRTINTGQLRTTLYSSTGVEPRGDATTDGASGTGAIATSLMAWNGAAFDRVRVDSSTNVKVANTAQNKSTSVTIASAGTTSGAITLSGNNLVGLSIPSVWDGGNITIQGCDTVGGTYLDVYDSNGNIATVTVGGASRIVGLTGSIMQAVANIPFIRLVCGTAVGANRTIIVFSKG